MARKISAFKKKHHVDAIAFTGYSGSACAYALSYKLGIPLICIRKKNRKSHFDGFYEGRINVKDYIIVDDFIETGKTIDEIKRRVKIKSPGANLVAIFLYSSTPYFLDWDGVPIFHLKNK